MSPDRKPGFIALIAALAVFLGYGHQLFGQFEHHHLGEPASHHSPCAHQDHHDHQDQDHHHSPDQKSPQPDGTANDSSCDQCPCALIPALAHTTTLSLPALTSIETVPALALSGPRADTRPIDHPPTA